MELGLIGSLIDDPVLTFFSLASSADLIPLEYCFKYFCWILIFLGYFSKAFFTFFIALLAGLLTFSIAFYFGRKTKRSILQQ